MKLIELEYGGIVFFGGAEQEIVEIDLGNPEVVYMRYFSYDGRTSAEMFIPALRFPVISSPDDSPYYRQHVTIPLVKEINDKRLDQTSDGGGIIPRPMPLPAIEVGEVSVDSSEPR